MLERLTPAIVSRLIGAVENERLPDALVRIGIRQLVSNRAAELRAHGRSSTTFAAEMRDAPVAVATHQANTQHYEVPSAFFEHVLGPCLKYSCCWYERGDESLAEAEAAMLERTCERAGIEDGMRILDLGCGWGSFATFVAEHYPSCQVLAISNSRTQRAFIQDRCARRGLAGVEVRTANAATLDLDPASFERVVSVEMFEHLRNWPALFERIARWLVPDGRFFQHVFCHRSHPYHYEDAGEGDWMARNFFSGGIMPSADLPGTIEGPLEVERSWRVLGKHYARTSRAWLENLDRERPLVEPIFEHDLGQDAARRQVQRWRMFFMACEELFGYRGGEEWFVIHTLLRPRPTTVRSSER